MDYARRQPPRGCVAAPSRRRFPVRPQHAAAASRRSLPAAWTLRGEAARDYEPTLRMVEDEGGVRAVAAERVQAMLEAALVR